MDQLGLVEAVLALGDRCRRERAGGDDVGAGEQVAGVEVANGVRLGEHQQIEIAGE